MTRDLPIGNENYLILFNREYQIAEIFYPHVGMENHSLGHPFRFGLYVDDKFSWLSDWTKSMNYSGDTLVTDVSLSNPDIGVKLQCADCVDFVTPIFIRKVQISNLLEKSREVRLFFHHDFHINGTAIGDTAYYDPVKTNALIHYKTDRYFLANCLTDSGGGIFQYACGIKESGGSLGTWKDAEDGYLSGNPIAQGSVDSILSAKLDLPASGQTYCFYWIIAGQTYDEIQRRNSFLTTRSPASLMKRTKDFWNLWVSKQENRFADLDEAIARQYRRSLLIIKSQTDADGAVIAANDSDSLQFSKDTYSYMWPRDGAFVTMAMDEAGYYMFAKNFFDFCTATILPLGWFFHKYQPDKSAGSSWHPWIVAGERQLPIQEDETALVLISLWNHFKMHRDVDLIKSYYRPIIKAAGTFMNEYRDATTRLPLESYDLWEERRQVLTYTSAAVYGGLCAAENFATAFGEDELAAKFSTGAAEVKQAAVAHLYDPTLQRFLRGVSLVNGKITSQDSTVDSSIAGIFLFGMLPANDPRVVSSMRQIEEKLWVNTGVGGLARYEQDGYQQVSENGYGATAPGNPWFITTLWLADWYIENASTRAELAKPKSILTWAVDHALPSGVMPEQLNPFDGSPLSVSPLTWSHGAFVSTVNRYSKHYLSLPA